MTLLNSDETPKPQQAKPQPVIHLDADPDNANWLRILAQRREDTAAKNKQPQPPQQ